MKVIVSACQLLILALLLVGLDAQPLRGIKNQAVVGKDVESGRIPNVDSRVEVSRRLKKGSSSRLRRRPSLPSHQSRQNHQSHQNRQSPRKARSQSRCPCRSRDYSLQSPFQKETNDESQNSEKRKS